MADWWRGSVIYQIYPRSFQDSNGDGIGDLAGITERLPYVADLGVDAIWLIPIFTSPMADMGYDVSDYTDIDPIFGSLADFDALLDARPRARAQGHHRPGAVALLRPAPVLQGEPVEPRQPQGRLVRLGRPEARRHAAEQLALGLRRPGLGLGRRGGTSTICTTSSPSSPTSTSTTRRCRTGCSRPCASGSSAASTASASTPSTSTSTTSCCATTRPTSGARTGRRPTPTPCSTTSSRRTSRRTSSSSSGCASSSTSTRPAPWSARWARATTRSG